MADISPFKGYRYSLAKKEDLGGLIAPPYDMLDDAKIESLYNKSPLNAVRIDQNRREAGDSANRDRHARAAGLFSQWVSRDLVRAEKKPSLYVYEQQFTIGRAGETASLERTGIIALVKLVDFSEGVVLPHEYTLSGPKIDRYEHLDATRLNVGQIFGLLSDDRGEIFELIRRIKKESGDPAGIATDQDGVRHTLYPCSDSVLIGALRKAAGPATILIADGHHRYETAYKFSKDHKNIASAACVMMTLVSMADPGLVIRSFHRLIKKGNDGRDVDMRRELGKNFTLTDLGPAAIATVHFFLGGRISNEMLFADSASCRLYGLDLNKEGEGFLASAIPDKSMAWKKLDMSKINAIAVNRILGLPLDGHVLHDVITYSQDAASALTTCCNRKEYWGGFFIRPVSISTIHKIVQGGERMPQKSTNFYPKLYSGLVFNRLED
ncbi:MAG: DUF1015 domain-containing protein [Chitinispirillaceae bacterium]|nr:DUF1015 domain-containing protein [Chitinispirillaceae bacterium]